MKINVEFDKYTIEIFNDPTYINNSTDNINHYDNIYGDIHNKPSSKHGVFLKHDGDIIKSLMLLGTGGSTGIHKNCYVIILNYLYICVGNSLFKINILDLSLIWKVKIDDATAFQVFEMHNYLIIHGELSISRLNQDGKIIWQNYGSDIFVTESENNFQIINNEIHVNSWDKRSYIFNFNGINIKN